MTASDHAGDELRRLQCELDGEDVRDAARALLEPGEQLRALAAITVAFGDEGRIEQWQPIEVEPSPRLERIWASGTRTTARKVVFFTLMSPVVVYLALDSIGLPAAVERFVDRLIGGRTCQGPRDSLARRVQHALSTLGGGADQALVSDRRLVLARQALSPPPFTPVSSLPLTDIVAARRRARGPLRRRVGLRFTDGSRIVLALGWLTHPPSRPAQFVAALDSGASLR